MRVGPIEIYESGNEIVANLRPDESIEVVDRREPTLKNPEISVDLGMKDGKYYALKIYYPKDKYSLDWAIEHKDSIIDKRRDCLICKRKQQKLTSTLSGMIEQKQAEKERVLEFPAPVPPMPPLPHQLLPPPPLPPRPPFSPPLPHEIFEELFGLRTSP